VTTVLWGDSIKVTVTFKNFAGTATDLDAVPTVKLFDESKNQIGADLTGVTKTGTGVYEVEFAVPPDLPAIIHEWVGAMAAKPIVQRRLLLTRWRD
jgi:hypothetical protein